MNHRKRPLPSLEQLQQELRYDPATGLFWWIKPAKKRRLHLPAGSYASGRYRRIQVSGVEYRASRIAWLFITGQDPGDMEVDHISGCRSDDRPENLRLATHIENARNRGPRKGNVAGLKGVSWSTGAGKWQASIRADGKNVYLGLFTSVTEAHQAYAFAAAELHGRFARTA
jgi:hypothetical protein